MKDEDIVAVSQLSGETKLIKHSGKYIGTAVVDDIEAENVAELPASLQTQTEKL